jgi:hypothetical protein
MRLHEFLIEQEAFDLAAWIRQWSTRDSVKQNAEWYAQKYPRVPLANGTTISWQFANYLERSGIMASTPLDSNTLGRGGWGPDEILGRTINNYGPSASDPHAKKIDPERASKLVQSMDIKYQQNPLAVEKEFTDLAAKHGQRLKPVGVQEMPRVNLPIPTPPKMTGGGVGGNYSGAKPSITTPRLPGGSGSQNFNPFKI